MMKTTFAIIRGPIQIKVKWDEVLKLTAHPVLKGVHKDDYLVFLVKRWGLVRARLLLLRMSKVHLIHMETN